jgi:hypothetical protein
LELERAFTDLRLARLTYDTEMMRARQGRSETQRQELNVQDQRQTDLALELRNARAELDRLRLREVTIENLLVEAGGSASRSEAENSAVLEFTIVRRHHDQVVSEKVSETALLEPGDVLKVGIAERSSSGEQNNTQPAPAATGPTTGPITDDTPVTDAAKDS